ncbi:MAG: hypothetical protein FWB78_00815, partial [Treponema sp.]|nr:hypothetical protein [Treponema sp.]
SITASTGVFGHDTGRRAVFDKHLPVSPLLTNRGRQPQTVDNPLGFRHCNGDRHEILSLLRGVTGTFLLLRDC